MRRAAEGDGAGNLVHGAILEFLPEGLVAWHASRATDGGNKDDAALH